MDKMWRIKFCANRECALGFKNGRQPRLIWGDVEVKDFDFKNVCTNCGDRLEMVQSVQASTGVKRRREIVTPDSRSVDGEGESKRSRVEAIVYGGPGNMTDQRAGLSGGFSIEIPRGPRNDRGGARGGLYGAGPGSETPGSTRGLSSNFRGGANAEAKMDDEKAADTKGGGRSERENEWCLKCHWSHHNTSQCDGVIRDTEAVIAELYWGRYNRRRHLSLLWSPPKDVYELMDQLATHQMYFLHMKRFFSERDALLRRVLEDDEILSRARPMLYEDGTVASIYEALVIKANYATKAFVVSVVQAIFVTFRAVVVGGRSRAKGETNAQFRARMSATVFESKNSQHFPLPDNVVETLKYSLDFAWKVYMGRMDNLEKDYLARHFSDVILGCREQRIARLPTSYMRLEMMTETEGKPLIFPVFKPVRIASLAEYQSHFFAHHLDDLYVPPAKLITGTALQANDELTKVEMPDELDFLNIQGERSSRPVNIKSEDTQE